MRPTARAQVEIPRTGTQAHRDEINKIGERLLAELLDTDNKIPRIEGQKQIDTFPKTLKPPQLCGEDRVRSRAHARATSPARPPSATPPQPPGP